MTDDFEHEVVSLHQFFQGWMNGDIEASEGEYGRLRQALAEGFTMVTPAGVQVGRDELLESMWLAHGKHAEAPLRIEIRNVRMRPLEGELWVAVYEEWHELGGARSGRRSTAILGRDAEAPRGVLWIRLNETTI